MGYQRSGTNALFNSLTKGGGCIPIVDVEFSDVYDQFFLRAEHQIRSILTDQQKPVLLKPVNETKKRSIDSVFEEYKNYDLRILYIYRDPVNAFFSQTELWPEYTDVDYFIAQWNTRNLLAIDVSPLWKSRLGIVKYEDLIADPGVFDQACDFFQIPGVYLFRTDKSGGRQNLPNDVRKKIDEGTTEILARLDQRRSFYSTKVGFSFRKTYRNLRFFLIQQLRKFGLLRG